MNELPNNPLPITSIHPTLIERSKQFFDLHIKLRSDCLPLASLVHPAIEQKCGALIHLNESVQWNKAQKFVEQVLCVIQCVWDGAFNQLDTTDTTAIKSLVKRATQRRVRTGQLKPSSAATYLSCWIEVIESGVQKPFATRGKRANHVRYVSQITFGQAQEDDLEEVISDHDSAWSDRIVKDQQRYRLDDDKPVSRRRYSRHHQVLEYNASPYQHGTFSMASLGIIFSLVEQRARELSSEEGLTWRVLIGLAVTTGRLLEDIAGASMDREPQHVGDGLRINLESGMVSYRPEFFVGHPARVTSQLSQTELFVNGLPYQPISPTVEFPIAPQLLGLLRNLHKQICGQCLTDILPIRRIQDEVNRLNTQLHQQIPHAPKLTAARLAVSFNAHFSGLDPIYSYYLQGCVLPPLHLPLRYSRVLSTGLARSYGDHVNHFFEELAVTCASLTTNRALPMPDWMQNSLEQIKYQSNLTWGSWRCATSAYVAGVLQVLNQQHLLLYSLVALCALTGLRPFEPLTLQPHQLAEDGSCLAIRGKPNIAHPAHRIIPVPISLRPLLLALRSENQTWLFQKDDGGRFELKEVECLLRDILQSANSASTGLDLYSLRHSYRSTLLAWSVPFHEANYLIGHQTEGCCIYDPYLDRPTQSMSNLVAPATRALERSYGICPSSRTN